MSATVNIVLFGIGKIGSALVNKILSAQKFVSETHNIELRIPLIVSTTSVFVEKLEEKNSWEVVFIDPKNKYGRIIEFVEANGLENIVLVDATASKEVIAAYPSFLQQGFDIVSVNSFFENLTENYKSEIKLNADVFEKKLITLKNNGISKELAVSTTISNILSIVLQNDILQNKATA